LPLVCLTMVKVLLRKSTLKPEVKVLPRKSTLR
jgi:hypothetical protein